MKYFLLLLSLFLNLHAAPKHVTTVFNAPKYEPSFTHFDYRNADAPKGGEITCGWLGSFDSFNPWIIQGTPFAFTGLFCAATLLSEAHDEIGASYAYLAESVDVDPELKHVTFKLRADATFDDGSKITARDVAFTFEALREKGHPRFKSYFTAIERVEVVDEHTIRFICPTNKSREIGLILGQLPVLSQKFFEGRDFSASLSQPFPSSGPYRIQSFDMGKRITFERRKNWWGEKVPSQRGAHNVDIMRVDFYKDVIPLIEMIKKGEHAFRLENISKNFATAYKDAPKVIKHPFTHESVAPLQALFFNTKRFPDRKVREALSMMLDFKWLNANVFYGGYTRSNSVFANSSLAQKSLPEGSELALLEPHRSQLPKEVFEKEYKSVEWATPDDRSIRAKALEILDSAGWKLVDGKLKNAQGAPLTLTILLNSPTLEKPLQNFITHLKELGVEAGLRVVDPATYEKLVGEKDFDMVMDLYGITMSPGNEHREFWTSAVADTPNTRNVSGIKNPVVDQLVEGLIGAQNYEAVSVHAKALSRVLLWEHYFVPLWHSKGYNVVAQSFVSWPKTSPKYQLFSWIFDSYWVQK